MYWMLLPLRRYFDFSGRSRRKEFWLWLLFFVVVAVVLTFVDTALGLGGGQSAGASVTPTGVGYGASTRGGILTSIFAVAMFIPNLAVQVRRLHDLGRTGWWVVGPLGLYIAGIALMISGFARGGGGGGTMVAGGVLMFAGFILALVMLVWFCLKGETGPNRFGPDPLGTTDAELQNVFR